MTLNNSPLVVGVDARSLEEQRTGIGRYLENVLREAARLGPSWRFHLYTIGPLPDDGFLQSPAFVHRPVRFEDPSQPDIFIRELRLYPPAAFFSPLYELPDPISIPSVITVHDMVHEATPSAFNSVQLAYLRRRHTYAMRQADRILTDSDFARGEILRWFPETEARLQVVPLACDPRFGAGPPLSQRERVLLYVGSIARKRHVMELLEAFRRSARLRSWRLILVGKNYLPDPQKLIDTLTDFGSRVTYRPYVSNEELVEYYRQAAGFVYLSTYEGFGMPILEAMASGTPVLAARAASIPEVAGDAALLLDQPGDVEKLRDALESLALDEALRADLARRGRFRVRRYSWERTARLTMEAVADVVEQRRAR